jgi:ABC-type transport system substrate-binding protein
MLTQSHRARRVSGFRMVVLTTAVLASALSACAKDGGGTSSTTVGGVDDTAPEPERGGNITYGLANNIDTFNPVTGQFNASNHSVAKAIFDPIAVLGDDGTVEPYLVESIEPNDDFTEWTLTARDGIQFHNGDPLTPRDIATHIKNVQLGPLTSFAFTTIRAVGVVDEVARPQYEAGEISEEEYNVQRRQIVVIMREPWSAFPATLAGTVMAYVAHPDYESGEIDDPIGTGPFVLDEWVPNDHATVVRNDNYWREGLPYLDRIDFRILVDPESRRQALEAGDVDMINTEALDQVPDLANDADITNQYKFVDDQADGDEVTLLLNTQTGPTADLDVRRALQLATDREKLNDGLYDGYYEVADAPYTSESFWYSDPGWPAPDVDAAGELVAAWEAANGPLSIRLTVTASQDYLELGQALAEQWEQAGIDVELSSVDAAVAGTTLATGDFDVFTFTYFNGADPDEQYALWDPDPENIGGPGEISLNFTRYTSDTQQEALHGARLTGDPAERAALYGSLWKDWAENAPQLWLFHVDYLLVTDQDIHGIEDYTTPEGSPAAGHFWGSVYFTEAWRDQ